MGKKTEALRASLEKALQIKKDRLDAMEDANQQHSKLYLDIGKLSKEPPGPERLKKKIKIDKELDTNWKIYLEAKKAAEKAEKDADAAQKELTAYVMKKKEEGKVIHALKQKLAKLKAVMK